MENLISSSTSQHKPVRIATWNINSVRIRLPLLERFVLQHDPDILCLQEIKCEDDSFPRRFVHDLGYRHIAVHGQKTYHGVAILSRFPFAETGRFDFCGKGDARHLYARFDTGLLTGVILHNVYVPAGGDEPDLETNPKFAHKIAFLREMTERTRAMRQDSAHARSLLVGDLNVAPLENDVWSHTQLLKVVSHTPIECDHLNDLIAAGWIDMTRHHIPPERKLYTWWSYRAMNWEASDRGRRLDHIWASPQFADAVTSVSVIKDTRRWNRPSDHVPIIATIG